MMNLSSFIKTTLTLAVSTVVSSSLLAADLGVSLNASAPGSTLLQITVPDSGNPYGTRMMRNWVVNPAIPNQSAAGRHREVGQTFHVPSDYNYEIDAVTFRIGTAAQTETLTAAGQKVTLWIYEVGGATNATPSGPALYEASGFLPAAGPNGMSDLDYITFTFDTPFTAEADTYYSIQLGFTGTPTGAAYMTFVTGPSSIYTDGTGFWYQNPAGSASMEYNSHNTDFDFSLTGRAISVVPEVGTVSLAVGGILMVGLSVLRQRRSTSAR